MSDLSHQIPEAVYQGRDLSRFGKYDYFAGEVAAIQHEVVLDRLDEVINALATRGEFITKEEWTEKRHGYKRDKSLEEMSEGRKPNLFLSDGMLCTPYAARLREARKTRPKTHAPQHAEPAVPVSPPVAPVVEEPPSHFEIQLEKLKSVRKKLRGYERPDDLGRTPSGGR
jgi:hypothetical protein